METRFVERLTRYKAPSVVEFRDQLPKSMIDKIVRRSLIRWLTTAAFLANLLGLGLIARAFSDNLFQMPFGFSPQVRT